MRDNDPVHRDEVGGVWGITTYADVKAVFGGPGDVQQRRRHPARQRPTPMMIDMDDPEHLRRRKLVNRGFTPGGSGTASPRLRKACDGSSTGVCEPGSATSSPTSPPRSR